jgi:hypothetical protein
MVGVPTRVVFEVKNQFIEVAAKKAPCHIQNLFVRPKI